MVPRSSDVRRSGVTRGLDWLRTSLPHLGTSSPGRVPPINVRDNFLVLVSPGKVQDDFRKSTGSARPHRTKFHGTMFTQGVEHHWMSLLAYFIQALKKVTQLPWTLSLTKMVSITRMSAPPTRPVTWLAEKSSSTLGAKDSARLGNNPWKTKLDLRNVGIREDAKT